MIKHLALVFFNLVTLIFSL